MKNYKIGLSVLLVSAFIIYFYLVTQSWTELPFSTCTTIPQDEYGDVLVPVGMEGLNFVYSPDNGFNTCRVNVGTIVAPFISLFAGVIIFALELFKNPPEENEMTE